VVCGGDVDVDVDEDSDSGDDEVVFTDGEASEASLRDFFEDWNNSLEAYRVN
jgi:hypothetical protein